MCGVRFCSGIVITSCLYTSYLHGENVRSAYISSTAVGILTNEGCIPYFCMSHVHSLKLYASFEKSSLFLWRFLRLFATSKFLGANNLVAILRFDRSASNS